MTNVRRSTDTTTSSHENVKFLNVFCMGDCLDECVDVSVEEVPGESFNGEVKKQNHVVNAAEILLPISRECSKIFLEVVLHFMHSSVSTFSDYMNEVPTLTKCQKKFEISACDKLIVIKMILEQIRSIVCAGVEERHQM